MRAKVVGRVFVGGDKANKRGPALVDDSKYCGGGIGRRKGNGN